MVILSPGFMVSPGAQSQLLLVSVAMDTCRVLLLEQLTLVTLMPLAEPPAWVCVATPLTVRLIGSPVLVLKSAVQSKVLETREDMATCLVERLLHTALESVMSNAVPPKDTGAVKARISTLVFAKPEVMSAHEVPVELI